MKITFLPKKILIDHQIPVVLGFATQKNSRYLALSRASKWQVQILSRYFPIGGIKQLEVLSERRAPLGPVKIRWKTRPFQLSGRDMMKPSKDGNSITEILKY